MLDFYYGTYNENELPVDWHVFTRKLSQEIGDALQAQESSLQKNLERKREGWITGNALEHFIKKSK